jgi:hypothetical protein
MTACTDKEAFWVRFNNVKTGDKFKSIKKETAFKETEASLPVFPLRLTEEARAELEEIWDRGLDDSRAKLMRRLIKEELFRLRMAEYELRLAETRNKS